ncbi:hypothetical protein AYK24_09395 [Thermoplasmatales archaeon SG8-52-4]|nr:MAG: hypothetical protein AYK24_09395 [Thermoplasmatales archaeon SG8-52-4]
MKNSWFRKGLFVGIIVLFIIVNVSSKDISVAKDWIFDDNNEIKPLDNFEEIITRIEGLRYDFSEEDDGIFFHHNVEIWASIHGLQIEGIRHPFERFGEIEVEYIKAPFVIGIPGISIIALGDIYWE